MNISMLKGKIHRATVKQAELDYVGSITVDPVLLDIYNSRRARKWDDLLKRTCSTLRGNRR